jgi:hypothetical protein
LAEISEQLRRDLLKHFQVNGAIPLTSFEIANLLSDMEEVDESNYNFISRFKWCMGGRIHLVAEDLVFPTTTVAEMWNLWISYPQNSSSTFLDAPISVVEISAIWDNVLDRRFNIYYNKQLELFNTSTTAAYFRYSSDKHFAMITSITFRALDEKEGTLISNGFKKRRG